MKKLLLCFALLALPASTALAGGINLSYDDCGTFGQGTRSFACNTNAGTNTMIGSFVAPSGVNEFISAEADLDVQTQSPTLPDWWKFKNAGTCRLSSLTLSGDFTSGPFNCADFFAGRATTVLLYTIAFNGLNRSHIRLAVYVPDAERGPLTTGVEYYAFKLTFDNAKTVGAGSCAGCAIAACVNLRNIRLVQPSIINDNRVLLSIANRAHVRWQAPADFTCLGATPTRNGTWGSIKALYR